MSSTLHSPNMMLLLACVSIIIPLSLSFSPHLTYYRSRQFIYQPCYSRPKSKWDDLIDDDDLDEESSSTNNLPPIPSDMTYIESNIKRQMTYYDRLYEIGGRDVINDVWVRAEGEKEWWLVGKIARVSGELWYEIQCRFTLHCAKQAMICLVVPYPQN